VLSCIVPGVGPIEIEGDFEIQPLSWIRETVTGQTGVAGVRIVPATPYFQTTTILRSSVDLLALGAVEDVAIQVDGYNGISYVLEGGSQIGELTADVIAGTCPLRFEGRKMRRIT
jgi:hypothetical protein